MYRRHSVENDEGTPLRKRPGVRSFYSALAVSNTGTEISSVAIPLVAIQYLALPDSWVAAIGAAEAIALMCAALPLGLAVDRFNRRTLVIISNMGGAIAILSIPFLAYFGALNFWGLLAAALAVKVLGALFDLASRPIIPRIVPEHQLDSANGVYGSVRSTSEVSGAGIGGILFSHLGVFSGFLVNALSFVVSAVLLARLPKRPFSPTTSNKGEDSRSDPHREGRKRLLASLHEAVRGFSVVRSNVRLARLFGASVTSNMFSVVLGITEIIFLIRVVQVPAWSVGLFMGVPAIGGIIGGLLNGMIVRAVGNIRILLVSQFILSSPILLLPLAGPGVQAFWYIIAWFFYSVSSVIYGAAVGSLIQRLVPDDLRGRVGAASMWINSVCVSLSTIAGTALLAASDLRTLVIIGAVGVYASAFWLLHPAFFVRDLTNSENILRQ